MIGWLLLGRASERRAERCLEAQAERQRLRAPEPGPEESFADVEPLPIPKPPRGKPTGMASLPWHFWVVFLVLIILAIYVNPWIVWVGGVVYGLAMAFSRPAP
jgi:hypothetical protein